MNGSVTVKAWDFMDREKGIWQWGIKGKENGDWEWQLAT